MSYSVTDGTALLATANLFFQSILESLCCLATVIHFVLHITTHVCIIIMFDVTTLEKSSSNPHLF